MSELFAHPKNRIFCRKCERVNWGEQIDRSNSSRSFEVYESILLIFLNLSDSLKFDLKFEWYLKISLKLRFVMCDRPINASVSIKTIA